MRGICFGLMTLLALLLSGGAAAQLPVPGENAIRVSLLPAGTRVPRGETVPLAIVMQPRPGWHGYWKNPGDAGTEMKVAWDLPAGVEAGPLRYPMPERLLIAGLMNYVYNGDYALLTELRIPKDLPLGARLPVRAKLDYLACTDRVCVPESATVSADLQVAANYAPDDNRRLIERYRQALPPPLGSEASFEIVGGRLRLAVPLPATTTLEDPYFFPATERALRYSAAQSISRNGSNLIIETAADANASSLEAIEGVLSVGEGLGFSITARRGAVPAAGVPVAASTREASERNGGASTIMMALLGAFLGGLLLNIMPCVFPILSLKALSLARGGDEAAARRDALAYAGGAILICLALGGLLLGLRAGGAAVGWAFQLQDPRVILLLLLLVTAIALNLAGLFELPALTGGDRLARSGGATGAFWTGALAAFIATPCTGPFMGAALGAALILPTAAALAVFGGLGLGLALPFLLLGFVPSLRRRLPKPGPWMATFRRIMALPMFLTALGLAWVLGRQAGADGMALGLAAALILGFALWWFGRRQGRGRAWLPLAPAVAAAGAALLLVPTAADPVVAKPQGVLPSEPFGEARLTTLRAEGRPVFVYFTADWCLTCKVNERGVLDRADVAETFAQRNVAVLVGDWTRGDAEIGRFLESHGRSGVPLYLYYAPGKPVEVLPQLLTAGRLTALTSESRLVSRR